jgi:hypothetical protein
LKEEKKEQQKYNIIQKEREKGREREREKERERIA